MEVPQQLAPTRPHLAVFAKFMWDAENDVSLRDKICTDPTWRAHIAAVLTTALRETLRILQEDEAVTETKVVLSELVKSAQPYQELPGVVVSHSFLKRAVLTVGADVEAVKEMAVAIRDGAKETVKRRWKLLPTPIIAIPLRVVFEKRDTEGDVEGSILFAVKW